MYRGFKRAAPGLATLLLTIALLAPIAAAAADAVVITSADSIELSDRMDWCETDPGRDVDAIASGGCAFAPATRAALGRGYSRQAFWLRVTLVNAGPESAERWLVIGQRRLQWVAFYEAIPEGGWRRSTSGMMVPPAARTVLSTDPILPVTLGPGERRTILVQVVSPSAINLVSTLWRPRAYAIAHGRSEFYEILAVGGLLVSAVFTLIMSFVWTDFQWSNRANLCFSVSLFSRAVFNASNAGLLSLYVLPPDIPYDRRIQAVSLGSSLFFFALFMRYFVDTRNRYRGYDVIIKVLLVLLIVQTGWALLIDYNPAFNAMSLTSLAVIACSVALMGQAWRDGVPAAGFLLVPSVINLVLLIHRLVLAFSGGQYSDTMLLVYAWVFILTVPLIPIGLAVHKDAIQRSLAAARAESAARVEFLARMSHELRTPLDTILGTAQLLSRPGGTSLRAEGLATIQSSGWHLLRMIDDILDHARGLAGKLAIVPGPVDWPEFLGGVERTARTLAARNRNSFTLRLSGPALDSVTLDEGRLRQVLDNLLANAARHTRNGRIELDCVVGPANADGTRPLDFAVTDTGEGIPLADQERIFRPFERGSGTTSQEGVKGVGSKGVGMGLAISRQLVEMMGGRLTVESRRGEGACFRFRVIAGPDEATSAAPAPIAGRDGYAGPRRTLLVADDADDNRRILATFLRDAGFAVIEATSGRAAIERCAETDRIDLVLTDLFMADGDGWTVLRTLAERRPGVPVVSISAAPPDRPAHSPAGIAFAAHLMKPLDHAEVLRCIADLLGLDLDRPSLPASEPAAPLVPTGMRPAPAAMEALRRMIGNGEVSAIIGWAATLKASEPGCTAFAEAVHAAARRLDFPALNKLAT